jgi:hypothetical protein
LFKLACLRHRAGDLTGALELYRELTSAVIPAVPALVNLAEALESQGDLAGADEALEMAWQLSGIEDYLFKYIDFRRRVGDEAGARELEFLADSHGLAELHPLLVPAWEAGELELAGDRMGALRVLHQARASEDPTDPIDSEYAFLADLPRYGLDADGTPSAPW